MSNTDICLQETKYKDKRGVIAYLRMSPASLERAMRDHGDPLPYYKFGNLVRFDPSEVQEWARRRRVQRGGVQ